MQVQTYHSPLTLIAVQAASKAGDLLRRAFGQELSITAKASPHDIVTECDGAAESIIIETIKKHFPSHAFLAEESGLSPMPDAPVTWIIDPLDGTLNFAHNIPLFCISIAALVGNQVEMGLIYQPIGDELFIAEKGHGAFLNDKRLRVSETADLHMAVTATGFPYSSFEDRQRSLAQFTGAANAGNPIRILGTAALSLAYVAAGRFDIYWGNTLNPWDVAAGKLLVEEAGGTVSKLDGTAHNILTNASTLATNTSLHAGMLQLFR